MILTLTTSMSIGGDEPTWEGEATFRVEYQPGAPETPPCYSHGGLPADPDEIVSCKCIAIDGRVPEPHEADILEAHVDGSDWFEELVREEADARDEREREYD